MYGGVFNRHSHVIVISLCVPDPVTLRVAVTAFLTVQPSVRHPLASICVGPTEPSDHHAHRIGFPPSSTIELAA